MKMSLDSQGNANAPAAGAGSHAGAADPELRVLINPFLSQGSARELW